MRESMVQTYLLRNIEATSKRPIRHKEIRRRFSPGEEGLMRTGTVFFCNILFSLSPFTSSCSSFLKVILESGSGWPFNGCPSSVEFFHGRDWRRTFSSSTSTTGLVHILPPNITSVLGPFHLQNSSYLIETVWTVDITVQQDASHAVQL